MPYWQGTTYTYRGAEYISTKVLENCNRGAEWTIGLLVVICHAHTYVRLFLSLSLCT
jgi:hypothetical protein